MGEEIIELTLDKEELDKANEIFEQAGLTIELAINLYLKRVAEIQKIPFEYELDN